MPEDWLSRIERAAKRLECKEVVPSATSKRPLVHLKAVREAAGLSQEQLAERLKISRTSVSYAERHETRCSLERLEAYVEACGGTLSLLLDFGEKGIWELQANAQKGRNSER